MAPGGSVVAPRPHRDWREKPSASVNEVGEPFAGELHARFDGEGLETRTPDHGSERRNRAGNRPAGALPAYRYHGVPRASLSPNP